MLSVIRRLWAIVLVSAGAAASTRMPGVPEDWFGDACR